MNCTGNSVISIVGSHKSTRTTFCNTFKEGIGIIIPGKNFIIIGRSKCSSIFVTVRKKMFHQRCHHPVTGIIALHSFYKGSYKAGSQKRIFTITFFRSAPAWIASHVSIWSPNNQTCTIIFRTLVNIACFISLLSCNLAQQFFVPHLSQTDSLWKLSGWCYR